VLQLSHDSLITAAKPSVGGWARAVAVSSLACYRVDVSAVEQTLRAVLWPREDVELAVLFGSAAHAPTEANDVDLGVRWRGPAPDDRDALLAGIERAVGLPLDVVDLDAAPPQLRFEIARNGIVIAERDAGAWSAFRGKAFLDWWDFRPLASRIHRAAIARLRATVDGAA
jgi:hypothetical protein